MTLREWIRFVRTKAEMTQDQIAVQFGVHRTTWVRWESGTHKPDTLLLMRIADWNGTSVGDLEKMLAHD